MRHGAGTRLRRDGIALAIVAVVYPVASALVHNSYYQLIMTLVPIWAAFGVSWNILSGYGGQLSFGHAAFFGIGAYTVTLALVYCGSTPWLGIPIGMAIGADMAVLIGWPTFRLRGHYFALAMLAYPLVLLYVLEYLGFQEMTLPMHRAHPVWFLQFKDPHFYTYLAVGLLVFGMIVCMLVENSRFGLALLAVRRNELAAEAAGMDSWRWKMRALVISGVIAAACGGLYACVLLIVTPDSVFGLLVSAQPVVLTLFGGMAGLWGPLIGAAVLVPLAELLNVQLGNILPGIQGVVYGAAIIIIMIAAPEGLFWTIRDRLLRHRAPPPAPVPEALPAHHVAAATPADGPLLQVEGLSKTFGGLRAVSEVGFSIASGEILGIIGPNGAGKSTLFKTISGVVSPVQGSVTFQGQDLLHRPASARASRHRAYTRRPPGVPHAECAGKSRIGRLHKDRPGAVASNPGPHPRPIPDPARTRATACRHLVGRRTADAGRRTRTCFGLKIANAR